jgi:hypothetical protein
MKKILLFIFLCMPMLVLCQDLTGTWEGSGGGTTYIRMVITHTGDSLVGYTYDEGSGYCKATFLGTYNSARKRLVGSGITMIERTPNHVLVDYDLRYSKEEDGEYLRERSGSGLLQEIFGSTSAPLYLKRTSRVVDDPYTKKIIKTPGRTPAMRPDPEVKAPPPAAVKPKPQVKTIPPVPVKPKPAAVRPKTPAVQKPVVPKPAPKPPEIKKKDMPELKKEPVVPPKATVEKPVRPEPLLKKKEERSSKLVETIYTNADTLKIAVYDNGEVDGDTVTVFLDNAVVLDRYRISEKAKELYVPIRSGQTRIIDLFANNLGSIPPNTALIIITAGKKRYELHASYDLKTNARIVIQYKE